MKNLCSGTQCGRFQFLLVLDLWVISFQAVIVFGLDKNLLFKSALGHCVGSAPSLGSCHGWLWNIMGASTRYPTRLLSGILWPQQHSTTVLHSEAFLLTPKVGRVTASLSFRDLLFLFQSLCLRTYSMYSGEKEKNAVEV